MTKLLHYTQFLVFQQKKHTLLQTKVGQTSYWGRTVEIVELLSPCGHLFGDSSAGRAILGNHRSFLGDEGSEVPHLLIENS